MLRYLPVLVILLGALWALVECVQSPSGSVRNLPKALWAALIIIVPVVGTIGWFLFGRPVGIGGASQQQRWEDHARRQGHRTDRPPRERPKGPDDDPDFLRNL
ncbi:MAG: PLD nuclease N-terminal domain-containing protein [Nostocoides sp.]